MLSVPFDYQKAIAVTSTSLLRIVSALVDHPDEVAVEQRINEYGATFKVRVRPSDKGQVIGKQGKLARSLRTVLQAYGVRHGLTYTLDIQ